MTMEPLEVALAAARAGGDVVARHYQDGVQIRSKAGDDQSHNLVTDADVEAERVIVAAIRDHFPEHQMLGEESHQADAEGEHLWIIDPLDGTNNFAHAIPHFAVSVAYYQRGEAVCGVVYNPITGDWYRAARGGGAFWNERPVRVATAARLDQAMIGVGFYYDRGAMMEATLDAVRDLFHQRIHGIRRFGTASLDLCRVACGNYAAYFEYELSPWDFAAGALFVREAGGRITTCDGRPLPLAKSSLLASNGALHEAVRAIVQPHLERIAKG